MTLRKNVVLPKNRVSCHEWLFALLVVDHETERFFLTAGKQKKNEFQPVGAGSAVSAASAASAASAGSSALPAAVAGSSPSFDIF